MNVPRQVGEQAHARVPGSRPVAPTGRAIRAEWFRRRSLLWFLVIAGAAPVARTIAVHQGVGIRASAVAATVLTTGLVLARWARGPTSGVSAGRVALLALGAGVIGAAAGGRIVGAWLAVSVVLGAWTVFGISGPSWSRFDRRSLGPVLFLSYTAAALARHPDRLGEAVAVSAAAFAVAALLARQGQRVERVRRGLVGRLQALRDALPAALWALIVPGMLWWCMHVWFWTLGVLRTDEIGYRAWEHGLGYSSYRSSFPFFGIVAWVLLVLGMGSVIAVRGRAAWRSILAVAALLTIAATVSILFVVWVWPHDLL